MQFRTKARAVDLLGKGQIADLPTAITELWKNGYDAYADKLTAEIFKKEYTGLDNDVFLLTDDGKGMSQKDIFEKWLVLGTDSKSRAELEIKPDVETLWKKPRIKAGEKGIGRLSVAFLGQPMLMLTKKIGSPIQLLFFDWRILENYNMYLEDINIPVAVLENNSEFTTIFQSLKRAFIENFNKKNDFENKPIWEIRQDKLKEDILLSVENASLSDILIHDLLKDFNDLKESHGSKFLIFEPIDQILELADENKEDDRENRDFIIASLLGFYNPFINIDPKNRVQTNFFIHETIGKDKDLFVSEGNFFSHNDYSFADILIEGKFDGYGKFNGKLKIYDEEIDYAFEPTRRKFQKKYYGDFFIKLAYSQGSEKDSKLNETAWKKINDKVKKNGGLYIYRDDFRVLPYGRPNADFLKFEERRNRRIGTYYFSYRRMFGYIGLTRDGNPDLKDKSSREGLINNDPYSAFESDLIAFFVQIAKDYFSDKAEQSLFLDEKKKLNQQHQAISEDKVREASEKRAFSKSLTSYPENFKNYEARYRDLLNQLAEKVYLNNTTYSDIEDLLEELHKLDLEFDNLLPAIPKRYKPTDLQLDRLNKYEEQILNFDKNLKVESAELMSKVNEKLELHELSKSFSKNAEVYQNELENVLNKHSQILRKKFSLLTEEYDSRSESLLQEFIAIKQKSFTKITNKADIKQQGEFLKAEFERLKKIAFNTLVPLTEHINRMTFDIDEEVLQGAYKARYDQMREQWSYIQDTAQLGIAVEIIDHEFNVLYSRINRLITDLEKIENFRGNKDFTLLETAFRSLEDKYDLLSPLYRSNNAITKEIPCSKLYDYVKDFFSKQLEDEHILIQANQAFLKHIISIKEPVLYTVIINIVNNAIYWMRNSSEKILRFDYYKETNEILILNSGRKIEEHRIAKIFDLFYSNRPTGRGIGLYLAKQSLNENYYDIEATNNSVYNYLNGACFIIKPLSE